MILSSACRLVEISCLVINKVSVVSDSHRMRDQTDSTAITNPRISKDNINTYYPGYFRTRDQQNIYEQTFFSNFYTLADRKSVNNTVFLENRKCDFQCAAAKRRKKRQGLSGVEHGCCFS